MSAIKRTKIKVKVKITGWVDNDLFKTYLAACDMAVQLRAVSRGETSKTVLDCMASGIPTIVNANGSMPEIAKDACLMLEDKFSDNDLAEALEGLYRDKMKRDELSKRAKSRIEEFHSPEIIALRYRDAIEKIYRYMPRYKLTRQIANEFGTASIKKDHIEEELVHISHSIALNAIPKPCLKQIFVDISAIAETDLKTGIERVTRSVLKELLANPPKGYRIEPVYITTDGGYMYAHGFTMNFMHCPMHNLGDEPIDYKPGDIFFGLDLHAVKSAYLRQLFNHGVQVQFMVYDLLPILMPQYFWPGAEKSHATWLETISLFDGVLCISKAVANEFKQWFDRSNIKRLSPFKIGWFHLGADIKNSNPSLGIPEDASRIISIVSSRVSFLMVGTIEPRKEHVQVIKAFEKLWEDGADVNLVIVGKKGWMTNELVKKIRTP